MRAGVALLLATTALTTALTTAGCSGPTGAVVAPPASAKSQVASSPAPSPRSSSGVKAAQLGRSSPVRLQIAAIGVDSALMALGLQKDGAMEVPPGGFPAGWYTGGPTPGEVGPAVIAGHIDMKGPGVFYRLHSLKPGDTVIVTRADGSKPVFRVERTAQFPKDKFPTKLVYGDLEHPGLRLITCGGSFNSESGHYEDNLVVFADLVAPAADQMAVTKTARHRQG